MANIDELQSAYNKAWSRGRELESEISRFKSEKRDAFEAALQAEVSARYGVQLRASNEAIGLAQRQLSEEKERIALTGDGAPYPLGTRLVQWEWPRWGGKPAPTKHMGIVDAITSKSEHPANVRYGRAQIGQYVVRLIKKDGTTSSKYHLWRDYMKNSWLPEGEVPPSR